MALTFIRRFLVAVALLALAGGNVFALPACIDLGTSATLSTYIGLGATGCTIGDDKTFSNFSFSVSPGTDAGNGTPTTPSDSDVGVLPYGYGFQFSFPTNSTVAYAQTMTLDIQYLVTVTVTPWAITSVYAETSGGLQETGDTPDYEGSVAVNKNLCLGAAYSGCASGSLSPGTTGNGGGFSLGDYPDGGPSAGVTRSIAPQTVLGVQDYITLYGGATLPLSDGDADPTVTTAQIDYIINQFGQQQEGSEIPEPATFLLIGSALLGLGALRRKKSA
jgi:hypothetical protein